MGKGEGKGKSGVMVGQGRMIENGDESKSTDEGQSRGWIENEK